MAGRFPPSGRIHLKQFYIEQNHVHIRKLKTIFTAELLASSSAFGLKLQTANGLRDSRCLPIFGSAPLHRAFLGVLVNLLYRELIRLSRHWLPRMPWMLWISWFG